jgi:hypothetical protein
MNPYVEGHRYYDEWTDAFGGKYHAAQDLQGKGGDAVYAVANGVVSYSYGEGGEWAGYGYLITIDHQLPNGSGVYSLYGHLSTRRWKKPEGEVVHKGDLIDILETMMRMGVYSMGAAFTSNWIGKKGDYYDFLLATIRSPGSPRMDRPGAFVENNLKSAGFRSDRTVELPDPELSSNQEN